MILCCNNPLPLWFCVRHSFDTCEVAKEGSECKQNMHLALVFELTVIKMCSLCYACRWYCFVIKSNFERCSRAVSDNSVMEAAEENKTTQLP